MRFEYVERAHWPRLAWIARCRPDAQSIVLHHGVGVEVQNDWYCEAVWDSSFEDGDFDRTDVVFGSGGRIRSDGLIFVSSGSTCDRLHSVVDKTGTWISNSLPCLLEMAQIDLEPFRGDYPELIESITRGLSDYEKLLPTSRGSLRLTYFSNLHWDGTGLVEVEKPNRDRRFADYSEYSSFLRHSMGEMSRNAEARERRKGAFSLISTLSSGYDSSAVSVLASEVGCRDAIAITSSRAGTPDSGDGVARHLGLNLIKISRSACRTGSLPEVPFLAAYGKAPDCYFGGAAALLKHRVLLTGFPGDHWRRNPGDTSDQIRRGDQAGLSLSEYRLGVGFIHCPVPYFGVRSAGDIATISASADMKPWDLPGWSKPICRRLVEEKGVGRDEFGQVKKAASVLMLGERGFLTSDGTQDMRRWLRSNTRMRSSDLVANAQFELANIAGQVLIWVGRVSSSIILGMGQAPVIWRLSRIRTLQKLAGLSERRSRVYLRRFAFQWAVHKMRAAYRATGSTSAP